MTEEQAATVLEGELLEARIGGTWVKVIACERPFRPGRPDRMARLVVRRNGANAAGRRGPRMAKWLDDLRRVTSLDGALANVYADWLDDQGEYRAAGLLREAFPLPPTPAT